MLRLHLCPKHRSMYSLNFLCEVSDLIFSGNIFQIFRPSAIKLLSPLVAELRLLTNMMLGRTLAFSFDANMFFIKVGLRLLTVLKVSVVKFIILFISIENFYSFLVVFRSCCRMCENPDILCNILYRKK